MNAEFFLGGRMFGQLLARFREIATCLSVSYRRLRLELQVRGLEGKERQAQAKYEKVWQEPRMEEVEIDASLMRSEVCAETYLEEGYEEVTDPSCDRQGVRVFYRPRISA